ncbi:hypothetical protein GMRT_14674 [Giardia muris]|uniref:Uncharacterized protein n=1 Tax=Giardia muris TaxID=5742 RepID=A0A4Z1T1Y6_GIAMU|nr:hypothetical protein GMRT_14674 [Giardia muris]|eukprot:TNJ26411.1 hypothetical protein GMRT_14674 [Giardia muris]
MQAQRERSSSCAASSALVRSLNTSLRAQCAAQLGGRTLARSQTVTHAAQVVEEQGATCSEVGQSLEALTGTFTRIKRAMEPIRTTSEVKTKSVAQLTAADLALLQPQAQTVVEEPSEGHGGLDDSTSGFDFTHCTGKTLQAQVAELRTHPELLKRLQQEIEKERAERQAAARAKQLRMREEHRAKLIQIAGGNITAKPIITNFIGHHRHLLERGDFSPAARIQQLYLNGVELDSRIEDVFIRRDEIDAELEQQRIRSIKVPNPKPILPHTFINQRIEIGRYLAFTSRLALLYEVCLQYSTVQLNNEYISGAAVVIQYYYRFHHASLLYKQTRAAAIKIQRCSLTFLNSLRLKKRRRALQAVSDFLLSLYLKNTWVGAAVVHVNAAKTIMSRLREYRVKKLARIEAIVLQLFRVDHGITLEKRPPPSPLKGGKKGAPPSAPPPTDQPTENNALLLGEENYRIIARIYLAAAYAFYAATLDACYTKMSDEKVPQPAYCILIPSYEASTILLTEARSALPEFRAHLTSFLTSELTVLEVGPLGRPSDTV